MLTSISRENRKCRFLVKNFRKRIFPTYNERLVFGLRLELSCPIDVCLALDGVLVLQVEPGNLQVGFKFVVDAVLLLAGFERDTDEHAGRLAPVLFAFVDVGKVLTDCADLMSRILN
jgi:hypothetical protein